MQDVQADNGMSQFTKTSNTIALCSLANFINAADRVIMPIAIIQMSAQFQWDLHGQGWILSAFSIGYICTMVCTVFFLFFNFQCMSAVKLRVMLTFLSAVGIRSEIRVIYNIFQSLPTLPQCMLFVNVQFIQVFVCYMNI